jgi:O-antigen/teichoic acid export membrane protein
MSVVEPSPAGEAVSSPDAPPRRTLKAFAGLTAVQFLQLGTGLVTGPLLARSLGADGRGVLAAIAVPLGVLPFVCQLGLGSFAVNAAAKGRPPSEVFGSLAVPLAVVGALTAAATPLIVPVFSNGRELIEHYLTIGLLLLPLGLLLNLVLDIGWGLSLWRVLVKTRAAIPLFTLVATVGLFAAGRLSVQNAALVAIAGGLMPAIALVPVMRRIGRPQFRAGLLREGLGFGVRAWPGTMASLANQRLDQLVMIPLVPSRELGLYAVAVTIASLSSLLSSQLITVRLPRIAAGEHGLLPQTVRRLFLVVLFTQVWLAIATVFLLVPVFGPEFADAKPLVFVLLLATLGNSAVGTLGQALAGTGRPGAPSVGEMVSLAITIPGLLVLLPSMGAMGAALVSAVAYNTTLAVLIGLSTRHFDHRVKDYLIPRRDDITSIIDSLRPVAARVRSAIAGAGR